MAPDPGWPKQASIIPSDFHGASSASVRLDVFPASRRPSCGRPSGKPATFPGHPSGKPAIVRSALFHRANPVSRPSVPLRANPSSPFRSPFEQALRAAFRGSFARRLRFRRTPGKWVRLWVSPPPRASSRLPHQSVPGFLPEGSRPSRHWRRRGSPCRFRRAFLDRERPI
jgi:hypothetical protein